MCEFQIAKSSYKLIMVFLKAEDTIPHYGKFSIVYIVQYAL